MEGGLLREITNKPPYAVLLRYFINPMTTTNMETKPDTAREDKVAKPSGHKILMLWFGAMVFLGVAFALWMFWIHVYAYEGHLRDGFSKNPGDWGTFGDYIGGVLNPFFSLLAFFALLWTIKIQTRALKISNKALRLSKTELELTRGELIKTADAAQKQVKLFQDEHKRSEIYSHIERLVTRINYNYKKPLIDEITLFDFVYKKTPSDAPFNIYLDKLIIGWSQQPSDVAHEIGMIQIDLGQLLEFLEEYETRNYGKHLIKFYQWEYLDLLDFLRDNKLFLLEDDDLYDNFVGKDSSFGKY